MTTVNETLHETLSKFHQNQIPSSKATYYVTQEYWRLLQARANAETNNQVWLEILDRLQTACPDYAVRDFTNLADNFCYQAEILLHQNTPFLDDEALLIKLGGSRLLLRLFVSVLGPFYHLYVEKMDESYQFEIVENKQITPVVQEVIEGYGYHFLDRNKLLEPVPDMTTPFHNQGEVVLFHCVFSDFMGFYGDG
jgi:hypothetical protein